LVQLAGSREVSLVLQDASEVVEALGSVRMAEAKFLLADGESLLV
jgi:hypothetical protein